MQKRTATLLGAYSPVEKKSDKPITSADLTSTAQRVNADAKNALVNQLNLTKRVANGATRTFYGVHEQHPIVSVVGLGPANAAVNATEAVDEARENVRRAVSS